MDDRCRRLHLPALMTTMVVSLALAAPAAHAADCAGANLLPALASVPTAKAATLCLLNDERAARGLAPLASEAALDSAATSYSQAMVGQRFFSHVSPGGQTMTDRLASYVASAGSLATAENLALGEGALATPSAIVKAWMDSDGHRGNILDGAFDEIGIGIAVGTPSGGLPALSATYTTLFGDRVPEPVPAATRAASASVSVKRVSAKRKQQISRRCHRVARRTKASKKARTARYDRCMRKELRAAAR